MVGMDNSVYFLSCLGATMSSGVICVYSVPSGMGSRKRKVI